jgi:hypothetical protein
MTDTITLLRGRRQLTKTIDANGDITPYPRAKTFDLYETHFSHIGDLHDLLKQLEQRRDLAVVRGKPSDPERTSGVRRLLYADPKTGEQPTLVDVPRRWLALDIDSLPRPDWIDVTDLIGCAAVVINRLPSAFRDAAFVVQGTAGHGLKPGIRIRLWCWLSRPALGAELKERFHLAPVDAALFSAGQLIYTAAPSFLWGSYDPLPVRMDLVPGRPEVDLGPLAEPPKEPEREQPIRDASHTARRSSHHEPSNIIAGLIRTVETGARGNRNKALYWAARRLAEHSGTIDTDEAARRLEAAAHRIGLPEKEAAATVSSGLRGAA